MAFKAAILKGVVDIGTARVRIGTREQRANNDSQEFICVVKGDSRFLCGVCALC
jgi:hypothetical protein